MVTLNQSTIPAPLKNLHKIPRQLFVSGEQLESLMIRPRIAIVGSRKVTPYGRGVTTKISQELAQKGAVIVSGLALGVDSIAHASCLDAGGSTIAVLPAGLDRIYPSSHTNLAKRIVERGGVLLSEYGAGSIPYPANFLERNRLIAALSEGVLVTEAAVRSGSLNTASHALELGLPVFAVPGNITSPLSEGCNNLIKAGAIPVTKVEDIINSLGWVLSDNTENEIFANTENERIILQLLNKGLTDGALLQATSKLPPVEFHQSLTMLEITGRIRALGANQWTLT